MRKRRVMEMSNDLISKKTLRVLCLVLAAILFYFSARDIYIRVMEYRTAKDFYKRLEDSIDWIETFPEPVFAALSGTETTQEYNVWVGVKEEDLPLPKVDFDELRKVNPEIVCWLYCPDTIINYPVCQGKDNKYYLGHLFDGTENSSGCLFIDSQQDPINGYNTVIYGHAMKDKSMFRTILDYQQKGQAFYDEHPFFYLMMPDGRIFRIELFSGYLTDNKNGTAWSSDFADIDEFEQWILAAKERSVWKTDVTVSAEDRVVTMSTCSFDADEPWFVVHGILVLIRTANKAEVMQ